MRREICDGGLLLMTILFIDDDREDVEMFCEVIREINPGANCIALFDCSKLEEYLSGIPTPDFIFLDGFMFPIDGKECLKRLKNVINSERTKIYIHSGSINRAEEQLFHSLGVSGVLRKGASYKEIRETLSKAMTVSTD